MSPRQRQSNTFERYALECSVSANPADDTAANALIDYLGENGYSMLGARREVAKLRRIASERKLAERYRAAFKSDAKYAARVCRHIAEIGDRIHRTASMIEIVPGGVPPTWATLSGRFTTADGTVWDDVSATSEMGYSDRFVPTRFIVSIGAAWLSANFPLRENSSQKG